MLLVAGIPAACVTRETSSPGTAQPEMGAERERKAFLWTASKDGRTHHLFGTMHAGIDAKNELAPAVWEAMRASDCFVMEADLSASSPREVMTMALLPKDESLKWMVKRSTWDELIRRLNVPEAILNDRQPWFATLLFLREIAPPGDAMDSLMQEEAKAAKKRIVYLETWREALSALAKVTTAADLDELVEQEDEVKNETQRLIDAYRTGSEAELTRVTDEINASSRESDKKLAVLLTERNELWRPRLVQALSSGRCFVAVGAAHLVGKGNLREILKAEGFELGSQFGARHH